MKKYDIPENWRKTCDGAKCTCNAHGFYECGCDADWTEFDAYEAQEAFNKLLEEYEAIWKNCQVIYFPERDNPTSVYPVEHNPHAKKDLREFILKALKEDKKL